MSTHPVLIRLDPQESSPPPSQKPKLVASAAPAPASQWHKPLFEDSLLEVGNKQRRQRMWMGGLSVALMESALAALAIVIPLWYTEVLPKAELMTFLTAPPPPPPAPPPAPAAAKATAVTSNVVNGRLLAPTQIPSRILLVKEAEAPSSFGVVGGVVGGLPGGQPGGVLGAIFSSPQRPTVTLAPSHPAQQRVQISQGVTQGLLVSMVQPTYPPIAKAARVDGVVVLKAIINKNGTIEDLKVLSGPAMLTQAAIDAVQKWRYRPYLLNGQPVEVETTVNVIFQITR